MNHTSKHRVWSPKRRLVRNIPETFKGLGLSQYTAFCPHKAMLAGRQGTVLCLYKLEGQRDRGTVLLSPKKNDDFQA